MALDGQVSHGRESPPVVDQHLLARGPMLAASVTVALGAGWVAIVQAVVRSTATVAGIPAPAFAAPVDRQVVAVPVLALAAVAAWTLVRRPLHGWAAVALVLAAAVAQLLAVRSALALDGPNDPLPSVSWFAVVMVGGVSGAALVGVALGGFRASVPAGSIVMGVGWAWLAVAGADATATQRCLGADVLRVPQPIVGAMVVGAALVVIGAVLIWRGTGDAHRAAWRAAAAVAVVAAVGFAVAAYQQPPEVIGSCAVDIA